jgi:hypothetical protein
MAMRLHICAALLMIAACAPEAPAPAEVTPPDASAPVVAAQVPAEVRAAATAALPGFVLAEATRKEREGRVYYDVEGARADGADVELDMLQTPKGWQVVEIQRDLAWADVPGTVRAAAEAAPGAFTPVRVIESTQTSDGAVIFELFRQGSPEAPAMEVRVADGKAVVMTTANPH